MAGGETQQEAVGGVQGLSIPSGQLEDSTQGGGKGGASSRGAVPASRIHCDEPDASKSGGGAVLQQAGDSGAVDQRRKASSEDDAAQLPSVPVQRGPAVVDCDCIQSGESLETACSATEDRELVLDELAAAVGENGRTAGEACAILLAFAGRRALEPEAVQQHAANDPGTAAARRLATQERGEFSCSEVVRRISVSGEASCGGQNGTSTPQNGQNEPITSLKMPGRFSLDPTGQEA